MSNQRKVERRNTHTPLYIPILPRPTGLPHQFDCSGCLLFLCSLHLQFFGVLFRACLKVFTVSLRSPVGLCVPTPCFFLRWGMQTLLGQRRDSRGRWLFSLHVVPADAGGDELMQRSRLRRMSRIRLPFPSSCLDTRRNKPITSVNTPVFDFNVGFQHLLYFLVRIAFGPLDREQLLTYFQK